VAVSNPARRHGDKAGIWQQWYRHAIPSAEQLLEIYLKERAEEEERGR
jgi:hypothetical protein